MRLHAFRRETRMRQANGCEPVLFSQIEAHKRFRWILLPVRQPVKASMWDGSIVRYSPFMLKGLPKPVPLILHLPPTRRSDSTWVV